MTRLLVKLFVKDSENINNVRVRAAYGTLGSVTGIILNILLAVSKYIAGIVSGSISVTADAINNLSDAGSSIISLIGVKVSAKPADKSHPYGHGRIEYISALAVAFFVLLMGVELMKSSISKIIHPEPVIFSGLSLGILIASIAAKLWLGIFNRRLGKKINSAPMMAVMKDSFSDCLATSVAAISVIVSAFSTINIDGYLGVFVAGFILLTGINILKDTVGELLGKPPEKELVEAIENKILTYDNIVGVHDLIIHDYGPNRKFASAHAEIPSNADIMEAHDVIDLIERDIANEFGMLISIHLDPIVVDDEKINNLRKMTLETVKGISEDMSIHDFRVVDGPTHTNLIFDLTVPYENKLSNEEISKTVEDNLSKIDERYFAVITVEHSFN
ncbi:MAG: cation diffusion facilitator family transporter [Candidatus Fimenecus sp.]